MKPGIHQITDEEYFANPAISNSDMKLILRSPAHYKYLKDNPKDATPAMLAGSSLHCAILEPDEFLQRHAIVPPNAPRKPTVAQLNAINKTDKAIDSITFWQQFDAVNKGKLVIKEEEMSEYMMVGSMIRTHPELAPYFTTGKAERAVFGVDPETGLLCKCKPDYLTSLGDYKICLEIKSTEDARKPAFMRTAHNFGYYTAAAFYQDVMQWSIGRPDLYLIVAFEREPPYGIKIYEVMDEAIERGRDQYDKALTLFKHCRETGEWPCYDTTIEPLDYPPWARD